MSSLTKPEPKTIIIEEAKIQFELDENWEAGSKTGRLDYGKVQYSFGHPHVEGEGREVNPSIIVTVDKGSWFDGEAAYLEEKLGFQRSMGDKLETSIAFGQEGNPLKNLQGYFTKGESGTEDHPYGQLLLYVTYWGEDFGFHMEIQTSKKDFEKNPQAYLDIISSLKVN